MEIAGGLTLMTKVIGRWGSQRENMIAVRVACTREQLFKIIDITKEHYEQETVMAYRVSDEVYIV